MYEDKIKEITEAATRLQKNCKLQLKRISIFVNNIIMYKVEDKNIIEHTLDTLLDLTYMLDTEKVYYKLLNYWKQINPKSANDYETFYLEIINDEDKYTLKKQKPEKM